VTLDELKAEEARLGQEAEQHRAQAAEQVSKVRSNKRFLLGLIGAKYLRSPNLDALSFFHSVVCLT
jgi:hypothetical protein